jgi:hypothetical protein
MFIVNKLPSPFLLGNSRIFSFNFLEDEVDILGVFKILPAFIGINFLDYALLSLVN